MGSILFIARYILWETTIVPQACPHQFQATKELYFNLLLLAHTSSSVEKHPQHFRNYFVEDDPTVCAWSSHDAGVDQASILPPVWIQDWSCEGVESPEEDECTMSMVYVGTKDHVYNPLEPFTALESDWDSSDLAEIVSAKKALGFNSQSLLGFFCLTLKWMPYTSPLCSLL